MKISLLNDGCIFLFLLMALSSAHAQETINEEQLLLNGYVDTSGKMLLTGYATPESLSYMYFLNGTRYTFDNNTNQLYVVIDTLTSKNADNWSLNFSLDGYYSDYSMAFYLPSGSEITRFEIQPELNYQVQVKDDSLTLSVHGYRVVSPWIKIDYKLATEVPGQTKSLIDSVLPVSIIIVLIAGATFIFYRNRIQKGTKEIHITGEMQKVIDTLSDKEKAIIDILLKKGGRATQVDIRYETGIPKSSLTGIINALKRKNIIKKHEYGRTNVIELSEWFLS